MRIGDMRARRAPRRFHLRDERTHGNAVGFNQLRKRPLAWWFR